MGAWAEDAFGNDTACDWAADFSDNPSMDKIEAAINLVIGSDEYLDADLASEALVACEIIARLKGNFGAMTSYSRAIDAWAKSVNVLPSNELILSAQKAMIRILGEDSELSELWDEDGINEIWHAEMDNLQQRVSS